jgi:hypothetical protein
MKGQDTMAANDKRQRGRQEINRLSAETRQKAWVVFNDLKRRGVSEPIALDKALQQACPSKHDPYFHYYYPNKRRELRIWEKHGLWPLSKPKDIVHDTGPHDSVEISQDAADMVIGNHQTADRAAQTPRAGDSARQRLDTVDFDPMEVAKIIKDYASTEGSWPLDEESEDEDPEDPTVIWDPPVSAGTKPVPSPMREVEEAIMTPVSREEAERIVRDYFDGDTRETPPSDLEMTQEIVACVTSQASKVAGGLKLTLDDVIAMLEWWRERENASPDHGPDLKTLPTFRTDAVVRKTVRLNADLYAEAEAKASEDDAPSGGTFSGLVEYLLWKHLGSDRKHLKE